MLNKFTKKEQTKLEMEIDEVLKYLKGVNPGTEEYTAMINNLEKLDTMNQKNKAGKQVSPDTIALIAGNVLGLVLILGYEKTNIITSKALGFVLRGRV